MADDENSLWRWKFLCYKISCNISTVHIYVNDQNFIIYRSDKNSSKKYWLVGTELS